MKKYFLFLIAVVTANIAIGQKASSHINGVTPQKINPKGANLAVPYPKRITDVATNSQSGANQSKSLPTGNHPLTTTSADSAIGTTIYDLQTNGSVGNRIVLNNDGTVSATWTMAHGATALPSTDRGTGYNYYNGTAWSAGSGAYNAGSGPTLGPQSRPESVRCGWPNIAVTATGAELIVSHEATSSTGNIHIMRRPVKGTGTWTESVLGFPDSWARMVVGGANGNTVHVISQTTGAGTPINPPYHGQDGAISYSRSQDGGITWDRLRYVIPAIDSSHYIGFAGDDYAIDAKGDTIAIAIGGKTVDVILLKSVDNGTTWTKTIVNPFPIPNYNPATMITDVNSDGISDTIMSNDGSVAVLLDNSGQAHVWFGNMRVLCTAPGTGTGQGLLSFPYTDGLMYWNESMGASAPTMIATVQDINGDGILNIYVDPTGATLGFGNYFSSLTSMPSAGIDAQGNIYLSYSSIFEGENDQGVIPSPANNYPGKSYRHTYIMQLDAGNSTWGTPQDITDPIGPSYQGFLEGVFGAMAKKVNGYVHEIVQNDASPGNALALDGSSNSIDPQSGSENDIVYYKIPVSSISGGNCYAHYTTAYDSTSNIFSLTVDPATSALAIGYHWDFGDGTSSTLSTPSHTYTQDTLYNVCMKIYTASGDSCQYCHIIGKDSAGNIVRTAGFTMHVINNTTVLTPNLVKETEITIAPNPFTLQTIISFYETQKNATIKITDVLGKEIRTQTFSGKQFIIEKGTMQAGIYFVQITDENKNIVNRKIVIQ